MLTKSIKKSQKLFTKLKKCPLMTYEEILYLRLHNGSLHSNFNQILTQKIKVSINDL